MQPDLETSGGSPGAFDAEGFRRRILGRFRPGWLGATLEVHTRIGSTGDRARDLLSALGSDAHGAVVVADAQAFGRGRHGNSWHTSPGQALALSVALWFDGVGRDPSLVPLAAGLAVLGTIEAAFGLGARLKWPNDVLLSGRKVGGVLLESRWRGEEPGGAVLGIGVNLLQEAADFPPELRARATSVRREGGERVDRPAFAAGLLERLQELLPEAWTHPERIRAAAEGAWIHHRGDGISLRAGKELVSGRFEGIGPRGELILREAGGLKTYISGEVEGVTPAGRTWW